jgi:Na+/citrate or Na+/malate symporter
LKGALFFVSFFLLFTTAVYLIPTPMFPGDVILNLTSTSTLPQATFLSALINGITYGLIAWVIFAAVMRKIGATESKNSSESRVKNPSQVKSQGKRSRKPRRY